MTGQEIKGRLDRIGKTPLEHFQDIKELEVADGPEITVEDLLPYKCEQVEKSLKALEIIKEKNVDILDIKTWYNYEHYCRAMEDSRLRKDWWLTEEEFNLLKEVLE
jgi:hypothetical protein